MCTYDHAVDLASPGDGGGEKVNTAGSRTYPAESQGPFQPPHMLKHVYFNLSGSQISDMQHWNGPAKISFTFWSIAISSFPQSMLVFLKRLSFPVLMKNHVLSIKYGRKLP